MASAGARKNAVEARVQACTLSTRAVLLRAAADRELARASDLAVRPAPPRSAPAVDELLRRSHRSHAEAILEAYRAS